MTVDQPLEKLVQMVANAIGNEVNDAVEIPLLDNDGVQLLDDDGKPLATSEMQPRVFLGFDAHKPTMPYVIVQEIDTVQFKTARGRVKGGSSTGLSQIRAQVTLYTQSHGEGVALRQKLVDALDHTGEPVGTPPLRISDIVAEVTTYQHDAEGRIHQFTVDFMLHIEDTRTKGAN
jgi:hypothetical protein